MEPHHLLTTTLMFTGLTVFTLPLSAEDWQKKVTTNRTMVTLDMRNCSIAEFAQSLGKLAGVQGSIWFDPPSIGNQKLDRFWFEGATLTEAIEFIGKEANLQVSYKDDGIHFTAKSESWTASDGRVIEAKFIKLDGESVVIEKDGTTFAVPFVKLLPASMALAKKLSNATSTPTPPPPLNDSAELRENGAFGFPQANSKVLADLPEVRLSAWSNAEWLYVQAVVWADGDDAMTISADGSKDGDKSTLSLDLDADQKDTPNVDRLYRLYAPGDVNQVSGGLYTFVIGGKDFTGDSKGRGITQYAAAVDGKKIRVDSYLLPLSELGKKSGDTIRLILTGFSPKPYLFFNSAGLRDMKGHMANVTPAADLHHDFTLGQQSGTIDPSLVPDGRNK